MSDIISEISRISEDELRMQIALIDNVNISNAVKETGYRLVNVLADVANSFTQSIGIKNSIDYEVKTDDILLWRIPEAELQANKALTAEDSPAWTLPKPVADE